MEGVEKIKELLKEFGGYIKLDSSIRCKMSPHQPDTKIYELSTEDDFDKYDKNVIATIIQRLKWLAHLKNEKLQQQERLPGSE